MGKREKTFYRFRNNPSNVRYEELGALLIYLGFEKRQEGTSHVVFSIQGCLPITIPIRKPFFKTVYVKKVIKVIDELDLMDEDD
jgi:hypothetical protein